MVVDIQVEALEVVQLLLRLAKQILMQQKYNIIRYSYLFVSSTLTSKFAKCKFLSKSPIKMRYIKCNIFIILATAKSKAAKHRANI